VDLHFTSVGRNSKLLLNVPPTREGLFQANDVAALRGYGDQVRALYADDRIRKARASSRGVRRLTDGNRDTFWSPAGRTGAAELVLREPARCSVVCLEEAIRFGQAVERYRVELRVGGSWSVVARGTTIGHRKLDRFAPVTADAARIMIEAALDMPRLARLSLF
jgi:alpha-L-fucosidase